MGRYLIWFGFLITDSGENLGCPYPARQLYARKLVQDLEETEADEPEPSFRGFGRSAAYSATNLPKKVDRRETQTNNSVSLPG